MVNLNIDRVKQSKRNTMRGEHIQTHRHVTGMEQVSKTVTENIYKNTIYIYKGMDHVNKLKEWTDTEQRKARKCRLTRRMKNDKSRIKYTDRKQEEEETVERENQQY